MSEADDVIKAQKGWAAAIVTNDPERIAAYQDPEWVIVTKNGVTAGDAFLEAIRAGALSHPRMEPAGEPSSPCSATPPYSRSWSTAPKSTPDRGSTTTNGPQLGSFVATVTG